MEKSPTKSSAREAAQENTAENAAYFKVKYKYSIYEQIFKNINSVFNDNYLAFISQMKRKYRNYSVDLFILLRKYQYFIRLITVNREYLCVFDDRNNKVNKVFDLENIINKEDNKAKVNELTIKLDLLPLIRRSEIDFKLKDSVLRLLIAVNFIVNKSNELSVINGKVFCENLSGSLTEEKIDEFNYSFN